MQLDEWCNIAVENTLGRCESNAYLEVGLGSAGKDKGGLIRKSNKTIVHRVEVRIDASVFSDGLGGGAVEKVGARRS